MHSGVYLVPGRCIRAEAVVNYGEAHVRVAASDCVAWSNRLTMLLLAWFRCYCCCFQQLVIDDNHLRLLRCVSESLTRRPSPSI